MISYILMICDDKKRFSSIYRETLLRIFIFSSLVFQELQNAYRRVREMGWRVDNKVENKKEIVEREEI